MRRNLILFCLILVSYLPCYVSNDLLAQWTDEDGFYENFGALLFLLSALVFGLLAIRPKLFIGNRSKKYYPERKYFFLLAILFFFAFGEEISWGQRIFDFATPEAIKKHNVQNEFNLHNLEIFEGSNAEGVKHTGLLALLSMHRLFYIFLLAYLLVIPLLYRYAPKFRGFINRIHLPVPLLFFGIIMAFNLIYSKLLGYLFPHLESHGLVEIREGVVALIIFILSISWINIKTFKNASRKTG